MAGLREQAVGIINVCKTAIGSKTLSQTLADNETIDIAKAIVEQARAAAPKDKVLEAIKLKPPVSWSNVQAAMEMVVASLPTADQISLSQRMEAGRKRVEEHGRSEGVKQADKIYDVIQRHGGTVLGDGLLTKETNLDARTILAALDVLAEQGRIRITMTPKQPKR